jgi:hypothetical protein
MLTMHLGRAGSTKGPCFTIKDYMLHVHLLDKFIPGLNLKER